jgi:proteasome assembly chaperone (PAC2) family protein
MKWEFTLTEKKLPQLNNPVFIVGLPGMGNVGKVVVDFLIDDLKAKKLYDIFSYSMPHSVFVNEKNLAELPAIEIYYKSFNTPKKRDLVLLAGDVQPIDEVSCYQLCADVLELLPKLKCSEIITLGGIGLQDVPKIPKVYCTGTSQKIIDDYTKDTKANPKIYGVVGPIVGVTGVFLGLVSRNNSLKSAKSTVDKPSDRSFDKLTDKSAEKLTNQSEDETNAVTLLAETIGHPMYLGIKGATEILKILEKKLDLKINLKELDKEIKDLEEEMLKTTQELSGISKDVAAKKLKGKGSNEVSYIG